MMNQNTVGNSSIVRVKIETNITIKTEKIDYESTDGNIPLTYLNADSNEKGNIVEFHAEETRVIKPEPNSGTSGSDGRFLHHESENIVINTVAIDSNETNFHAAVKGNAVQFYDEKTCFVKPELNSYPSGDEERHLRNELPETKECFSCPQCEKAFSFKHNLTRHIKGIHRKLKDCVCQQCNHAFSQQSALKNHIDAVHLKLKKYICSECSHAFSERGSLKRHLDEVHLKRKKHVCQECRHAFSIQSYLKKHIDAVHLKLRKYICQECSHAFSKQTDLKRHVVAVHLKLKKFSCAECDRSFADKRNLRSHIQTVHIKL